MITNYELRGENENQVLYLYFDFNDEFSKFKIKEKAKQLEEEIKEYIKKNKIAFKGTTIAIIVSGVVVGILNFKTPVNTVENNINDDTIITSLNLNDSKLENNLEENINDQAIDENIEQSIEMQNQDNISTTNNNENQTQNMVQSEVVDNSTSQNIDNQIQENISSEVEKQYPEEEQYKEETQEVKNYITIYRSNGQVIDIEFEDYIIGVVAAEMPASFNIEALKAQAVIARTYALKTLQRGGVLTDSSSTQNYKNNSELQNMWGSSYNTYYSKIKSAVESTEGMYLTYNGQIIDAVYHSTSNGTTEDSRNVWGNYYPYLVSVDSPYDSSNPSFYSETLISYSDLSIKLQDEVNIDTSFNILSLTSGNRVEQIEINGKTYTGVQIRNLLGLRSADFTIVKQDNGILFQTKGYGHGVGLSQYGANWMAKAGYSFEQILKHYYTGVSLVK